MDRVSKEYEPTSTNLATLKRTEQVWTDEVGWVCLRPPDEKAVAKAVAAGIMFAETRYLDHDGWIEAVRAAVARVSTESVSAAFLASLTSHRLDLRSALCSFAVAHLLPAHSFVKQKPEIRCRVCGWWDSEAANLNELNLERFIYGGVNVDDIRYVAFDLEQFLCAPKLLPQSEDINIGQAIIDYLRQLPPKTTAAQAVRGLKMFKANADERGSILHSLGVCGILNNPDHPGYASQFVPARRRDGPPGRFGFKGYPTWWWTAANGISDIALNQFLPQLH